MKPKPALTQLDDLMAHAEGYANCLMQKNGRVPPTVVAATPRRVLCYVPHDLADVWVKDNFANAARLNCAAYAAEAVVMVVEAWVTMAKPDEPLDDTPPSKAFDRREFVVLMGEAAGQKKQKLLPIIRTGAGGSLWVRRIRLTGVRRFSGALRRVAAAQGSERRATRTRESDAGDAGHHGRYAGARVSAQLSRCAMSIRKRSYRCCAARHTHAAKRGQKHHGERTR